MLLQIHEPGQTPNPHQKQDEPVIGIDLGTTYSLVGYIKDNKFEIILNDKGKPSTASIVTYDSDGEAHVGDRSDYPDLQKPYYTIASIKRLMGKSKKDIEGLLSSFSFPVLLSDDDTPRIDVGGKQKTAIEISADILSYLKKQAEKSLGRKCVKKAVITVPAYFDDVARNATRQAAHLAGLQTLRLVNEPTAAALAYGLDKQKEGVFAIYDLGGGTFDVSILKLQKGIFQVLATGGNIMLGGDDFDKILADYILQNDAGKTFEDILLPPEEKQSFIQKCRQFKEKLSVNESISENIKLSGLDLRVNLKNNNLDIVFKEKIEETFSVMQKVFQDAGIEFQDLAGLVLVGGSTKMPSLRKAIEKYTNIKPLTDIDPDQVVACGAAQQAYALSYGSDNLLLDVTPLSLGVELMGGIVEKIIDRNSPIPVSKSQEFTSHQDGQTGMIFHIVQGEREIARECRSLGTLHLRNIPPMVAGMARVQVTFTLDADGLLSVSAQEKTTGQSQFVEIKPSYGLTEDEMIVMIKDSMTHAKGDMEERLLREASIEAQQLIHNLSSALQQDGDLLNDGEKEEIDQCKDNLKKSIEEKSYDKIRRDIERLNETTTLFAQRRMDKHFQEALGGKKVNQVL